MRHIMCVHLPRWPIDRLKRRWRKTAPRSCPPIVLVRTVASRQVVEVACERAVERGIRPAMTLAQARALCPALIHREHAPEKDLHALTALARWMIRFTPIVATSLSGMGSSYHGLPAHASSALFLDVTGCQRLYGGLANLMEQVAESLRSMSITAHLAIAPTPGAAWAIASTARENGLIVPESRLTNALAPLPPVALRIDGDTAATLHHLGIETIGQLLALPRTELPARFGPQLLTRIGQALGQIPEPLIPLTFDSPIDETLEFDGAVDSPEPLWLAFKHLLDRALVELKRRGHGARDIRIHFLRPDAPPIPRDIHLSRPTRNAVALFNLLRCALDALFNSSLNTQHSELSANAGFIGLRLEIRLYEPLTEEQALLHEQDEQENQVALDDLIDRLVLRLGMEAVVQPALVESHIPEKSVRLQSSFTVSGRHGRATHATSYSSLIPSHSALITHHSELPTLPLRPLLLLSRPVEIAVMVSPSHDRDGRPISITHNRRVHRIVHAVGPERIAGQWWEGHKKTRDYFAAENELGRRWWVFRVRETGKWYLHGEFD